MIHENRRRAESFGENAQQYDRARPTYPEGLVDFLMADGPQRVLDVGCGTGKAGRLFLARGCDVLGVELDARMADVARSHGLAVEVAAFEAWDPAGRVFDLLVSGQAWHWIDPAVGLEKAADVLRPGGRFAVFWNLGELDPPALEVFLEVHNRLGVEIGQSAAVGAYTRDGGAGSVAALESLEAFERVEVRRYFWELRYSRDEWLDQLQTHSDHRILPADTLNAVLRGIGAAIDDLGGSIAVQYETMLVTATRL